MDLNETLYHIAHPLRCLVLLSLYFFSFFSAEVRQFLVVKKKKNSEDGHYFPTRQNCFQVQLNISTWGQQKVWPLQRGDRCREVINKSECMDCPPRQIAVVKRWPL